MTKREMFLAIREVVSADAEMVAFIDKEIDLLNRKSASRKPTKTQTENEVYKADILVTLSTADAPLSIKDIQAGTASLEELSNQRISHLMKALVDSGQVAKVYVKKVPLFSLAWGEHTLFSDPGKDFSFPFFFPFTL